MDGTTTRIEYPEVPAEVVENLADHLKITDYDEEQVSLKMLLHTATEYAEHYMGRTLINSKYRKVFKPKKRTSSQLKDEGFTLGELKLPYPPVTAIDSVTAYGATSEVTVHPTYYTVDIQSEPAEVFLNVSWYARKIAIEYYAGYGDSHLKVPYLIRQGILQHAGFMYKFRGDCPIKDSAQQSGATDLYNGFRVALV